MINQKHEIEVEKLVNKEDMNKTIKYNSIFLIFR
jgi:hypothetical protein